MTATRIYIITDGEKKHLVQAASGAQALMKIVKDVFKVKVATTSEVAELMTSGIKVVGK